MSAAVNCSDLPPATGKHVELTLYDQHRKPHIAITDDTEVLISPRSLNSELCCPICLDLLKSTMTTKECLHRFCQECITTALMRGNKECPTCRKKLVSKRSLRPDPNFDALISKIYANREEYDEIQERALQRFNRQWSGEALQRSIEEGLMAQAHSRRQRVTGSYDYEKRPRRRKQPAKEASVGHSDHESSVEPGESELSAATNTTTTTTSANHEIELILKPSERMQHTDAHTKQTRYLKTSLDATVEHLCKYLSIRGQLDALPSDPSEVPRVRDADDGDSESGAPVQPLTMAEMQSEQPECHFRVSVASQGDVDQQVQLSPGLSLAEVRVRHWPLKRPLELWFDGDSMEIDGGAVVAEGQDDDRKPDKKPDLKLKSENLEEEESDGRSSSDKAESMQH